MMSSNEMSVNAPETLLKYDAPMFAGIETNLPKVPVKAQNIELNAKLDDMVNAMLPPR